MSESNQLENDLFYVRQPPFSLRARQHFFFAMQQGYATEQEKGTIAELPGSKTIEYIYERWRILDTYVVSPQSDYSGGTTYMWYGSIPVWMMQYVGWYAKEAIPCLKEALRACYNEGEYMGGRGPEFFEHEGFTYINVPLHNKFTGRTAGQECIFGRDGKPAGMHLYQAMWLIKE